MDQLGAKPHSEDMKTIKIEDLGEGTKTDFDLYLQISGLAVLYAPSPYLWSDNELQRLIADGHDRLYYQKKDESKVTVLRKVETLPRIDFNLAPVARLNNITDVAAEFTRILFSHPLTPAAYDRGVVISRALKECLEEDLSCIRALKVLGNDDYSYFHSARVSAYAIAIALKQGLTDTKRLTEIGIGCMMHDIGKANISKSILERKGPLGPSEWAEVHKHPEYGHAKIAPSLLSTIPREIVLHHHERNDGSGYPHGLTERELLPEVQIVAFADVLDALTSKRPYRQARTRFQALDTIKLSMKGALSEDCFKAMIELLSEDSKFSKRAS